MFLIRSFLYIPQEYFTDELEDKLTIHNPAVDNLIKNQMTVSENIPENFILYERIPDKGLVRIPRYALGNFMDLWIEKKRAKTFIEDNKIIPIKIDFVPPKDKKPNSEQLKTVDTTIEYLDKNRGCVIIADAGEGKSQMAIDVICRLKVKTLILVHKNYLIKQWVENLLRLTNLTNKDIGLLKAGRFIDGSVVIGSQASLMHNTIDSVVDKKFSLVIQDEVHRIGAQMFLRSFTRFNSRYRLGLSATPDREDKLENLYFLHTSDLLVEHKSVRRTPAQYCFISYLSEKLFRHYSSYISLKEQILRNLEDDSVRNNLVMKAIVVSIKNGRKVLVLGDHVKHLYKFLVVCREEFKDKNVVRFFGARKLTVAEKKEGLVEEKYKDPSIKEMNEADLIIATYRKAMEGIDLPFLDTIILLTPVSSKTTLRQVIGRSERKYSNKKQPLVIDIWDRFHSLSEGMGFKRIRLYKQWNILPYDGKEYEFLNNSD